MAGAGRDDDDGGEDLSAIVEAEEDAVDRSVHPSGIVPVLQCVGDVVGDARGDGRGGGGEGGGFREIGEIVSFGRNQWAGETRRDARATECRLMRSRDDVRRNIVATVNLDCKLDLKTIAFHARNVEYNPKVRRATRAPTLGEPTRRDESDFVGV